jgi:hypothetical protein
MALTPLQVQSVCMGKNPCKYLTHEMVNKRYTPLCLKKAPGLIQKKKEDGTLPWNFKDGGDNCPGYTYLKHVRQGYDV